MDRQIIYPGSIPLETDLLNTARNALVGVGMLALDVLGSPTVASGLACTQLATPALSVQVGAGRVYSLTTIDGAAYSSLAADTTHSILKQGILADAITLACAAPGTAGQSINYLVQATYLDSDTTPVTLPYYNASNPTVAYSGPANSGTAQNTQRKGAITLSAKAGTAAATGTQATPAPDSGYIGLYVVTVANGQTTVLNANISVFAATSFISLPALLAAVTASGGNVGIGQTAPSGTLHLTANASDNQFFLERTGSNTGKWAMFVNGNTLHVKDVVGAADRVVIDSTGNFLVNETGVSSINGFVGSNRISYAGTSANTWGLWVRNNGSTAGGGIIISYTNMAPNGTGSDFVQCVDSSATVRAEIRSNGGLANFSANNVNLSDERLKKDFGPSPDYMARWSEIEFVSYLYKDQTDSERNLGVKAQQLLKVFPELVDVGGFGHAPEGEVPYMAVYQTDFQYATGAALQQAIHVIRDLQARVDKLEVALSLK